MTNWFCARLLFQADVSDDSSGRPLFEVSIRVLVAATEAEAIERANKLGALEQHSYRNGAGDTVQWRFVEVCEVQDLCVAEIADGEEIYARLFRDESTARQ